MGLRRNLICWRIDGAGQDVQCFVKMIATNGSKQHRYKYVTDATGLTVMFLVAQKSDVGSFDEASF